MFIPDHSSVLKSCVPKLLNYQVLIALVFPEIKIEYRIKNISEKMIRIFEFDF